jgi:hypothetical protein
MRVGTLGRPGVFKLRSRGRGSGAANRAIEPPEAPDRRGHGASSLTEFV